MATITLPILVIGDLPVLYGAGSLASLPHSLQAVAEI